MSGEAVDSRHLLYLPLWARWIAILILLSGLLTSLALVMRFLGGGSDSLDWLQIGISGVQFMGTATVVVLVLFVSQTDATIDNLRRRSRAFLEETMPVALGRISIDASRPERVTVACGTAEDLFGFDYRLDGAGGPLMRLWCGINVNRLIVIYRMRDKVPDRDQQQFAERLRDVFAFSFGGAEAVGYKLTVEPLPEGSRTVALWLTVSSERDILTDPAAKLFWSQDIAMMTQSVLRTALRHADELAPDVDTIPYPM